MKTSEILYKAAEWLDKNYTKDGYTCHAIEMCFSGKLGSDISADLNLIFNKYKFIFRESINTWANNSWFINHPDLTQLYSTRGYISAEHIQFKEHRIMMLLFAAYICELEGD